MSDVLPGFGLLFPAGDRLAATHVIDGERHTLWQPPARRLHFAAVGCFKRPVSFRKDLPMRKFAQAVVNFMKREDGPTAVEYAVMLALIIVVCITAITALGTNANKTFNNVGSAMANVGS
jgi:pilus assembly protein Flp/PilA